MVKFKDKNHKYTWLLNSQKYTRLQSWAFEQNEKSNAKNHKSFNIRGLLYNTFKKRTQIFTDIQLVCGLWTNYYRKVYLHDSAFYIWKSFPHTTEAV